MQEVSCREEARPLAFVRGRSSPQGSAIEGRNEPLGELGGAMHKMPQPHRCRSKEVSGLTMYHGVRKLLGEMNEAKRKGRVRSAN